MYVPGGGWYQQVHQGTGTSYQGWGVWLFLSISWPRPALGWPWGTPGWTTLRKVSHRTRTRSQAGGQSVRVDNVERGGPAKGNLAAGVSESSKPIETLFSLEELTPFCVRCFTG